MGTKEDSEKGLNSRHLVTARYVPSVGGQDSSQGCVRHLQVTSQTPRTVIQPGSSSYNLAESPHSMPPAPALDTEET